ncbi:MAG: 50S ribosomal protein L25 [Candidatus Tectimicrobiota bacterium]|nr:MAG: 50S ribosomal protein L25 [Candidatus Tectomicrobia bacterium]
MEAVKLVAQRRPQTGKGAARRLRRAGYIPAVLYGHGVNAALAVAAKDLAQVRQGGENVLVDLVLEGENSVTYSAIVREVQIDPVSQAVLHVDFYRLAMDEPIRVTVPLAFVNVPEERLRMANAQLVPLLREVEVECLPRHIPETIAVDLSTLELGEVRRAGELLMPPGVTLLTNPEEAVVTTEAISEAVEVGEAEAAAEETAGEATEA